MKRKTIRALALLTAVLLAAAVFAGCDPYAGKRPINYPGTAWTCADPDITFYVRSGDFPLLLIREASDRDLSSAGVSFDYGAGFYIRSGGEDLLTGQCRFSPTELRVKVDKDELFGGRFLGKTLIFTSAAWDESDLEGIPVPSLPKTNYNLCGVWVLNGTDASGAIFKETMILRDDDTVQLTRETADQQKTELTGTWETDGSAFTLNLSDGTVRACEYRRLGIRLTLTENGQESEYILQ